MFDVNSIVGDYLGEYRLTALATVTSSSFLFLAEKDSLPGQVFLIKRRIDLLLDTQEQQEAFLRQVDTVKAFRHPCVQPIFDAGFDHAIPYIVTAYAENGSLYDSLKQQPSHRLSLAKTYALLARIGKALHAAHQEGLFHGNIKTQNIVFNAQKEALLADFLLLPSSPTRNSTKSQKLVNQRYNARELRTNQGKLSKESDQYALSTIAYELFTGQPPFIMSLKTDPNKIYKMRSLIPPRQLNPDLPSSLEQALLKALAKDANERYSDIPTFLADLGTPDLSERNMSIFSSSDKETPLPPQEQFVTEPDGMKSIASIAAEPTPVMQKNTTGMPYQQIQVKSTKRANILSSIKPERVSRKLFILMLLLILLLFGFVDLIYNSAMAVKPQPVTSVQSLPIQKSSKATMAPLPTQKATPTPLPQSTAIEIPIVAPTSASQSIATPTSIAVIPPRAGCTIAYNAIHNGNDHFTATISITNTGTVLINGWMLSWTYTNGEHISSVSGAQYMHNGAQVTLQSLSENRIISPGKQINNIIVNGKYNSHRHNAPNPTNFSLNGIQCV